MLTVNTIVHERDFFSMYSIQFFSLLTILAIIAGLVNKREMMDPTLSPVVEKSNLTMTTKASNFHPIHPSGKNSLPSCEIYMLTCGQSD